MCCRSISARTTPSTSATAAICSGPPERASEATAVNTTSRRAGIAASYIIPPFQYPQYLWRSRNEPDSLVRCRVRRSSRVWRPVAARPRPIPAPGGAARAVRQHALAADRPRLDVGTHLRHRRLRAEHQYLVRRHGARRRVEDRQQRYDLRAAAAGPGTHVDRRPRRVAEQPGPRLRRQRWVEQPPEHVVGRRRLQVTDGGKTYT